MEKEKIAKIIDASVLGIAIVTCGVNACLSIFSLVSADYAIMGFILLFAISIHLITSVYLEIGFLKKEKDILKKIETATATIINSLKGVEIKLFDTIDAVDLYVSERILTATKCVYDLNWQDYLASNPNPRNPIDRAFTENQIDKNIKAFCAKKSKIYNEVFTFSYVQNIQKMEKHMTYGENYSCSYFDNIKHPKFPKLQFVIIDDNEVIFVSSAYKPNFCAIRDTRIASIFINYFHQAWSLSQIIKDKGLIDRELVNEIKTKYIQGSPSNNFNSQKK